MTDTQRVIMDIFNVAGNMSHYSVYHTARAGGHKFSPSSVRTRVSELVRNGYVRDTGSTEITPAGRKSRIWGRTGKRYH